MDSSDRASLSASPSLCGPTCLALSSVQFAVFTVANHGSNGSHKWKFNQFVLLVPLDNSQLVLCHLSTREAAAFQRITTSHWPLLPDANLRHRCTGLARSLIQLLHAIHVCVRTLPANHDQQRALRSEADAPEPSNWESNQCRPVQYAGWLNGSLAV